MRTAPARLFAAVTMTAALTAMPAEAHALTDHTASPTDAAVVVLETHGLEGRVVVPFEPLFDSQVVALTAAPVQDPASYAHLATLVAGERYEADRRLYRRTAESVDQMAVRTPEGVVGLVNLADVAPLTRSPAGETLTRSVLRPSVTDARGLWAIAAGGRDGEPVVRVLPHGAAPEVGRLDEVALTDGVTVTGSAGRQGLFSSGPSTLPWRYVETVDGELAGWVPATTVVTAPTFADACAAPRTVEIAEDGALLVAPDTAAERVRTVTAGDTVTVSEDLLRGWLTVCDSQSERVVWLETDAPAVEAPTARPTSRSDMVDDLVDEVAEAPADGPTEPAAAGEPKRQQLPLPLAGAGLGVVLLAGVGVAIRSRRARGASTAAAMGSDMDAAEFDALERRFTNPSTDAEEGTNV